ncbi:alanyl-tRNA editing protein [Fodinicurvata sp. EGI_FJ10296]|uniref:alanyl-tRNA editing protein n=1 Tax=Fodinicurvata sp. EGI_FJ10296 TaxID=3231908 RepID=UPI003455BD42
MPQTETLFRAAPYDREMTATVTGHAEGGVVLDRTVFYPTGGGQPGDSGVLSTGDAMWPVSEAIYGQSPGNIVHRLDGADPLPPVGSTVTGIVDWDRRLGHMRIHTTLHLLCAIVDGWVTGGSIGKDRGRLDFDLETAPDKDALTDRLNVLIAANHPVVEEWIDEAELDSNPEMVRTLSVKPPRTGEGRIRLVRIGPPDAPIDRQPCGGTHVASTGEIGPVTVAKIEKKGRQNRRIAVALATG